MEIHNEMVNVFNSAAPSKFMVCKWTLEFKHDLTSSEEDHCSWCPKSTILEIIKTFHSWCSKSYD